MGEAFGAFLRRVREEKGFGLREFAAMIGERPSNLSAIENGNRKPWMEASKIELVAMKLGLARGTSEWAEFFSAARMKDQMPADVQSMGNRELVPSLLRTVDGKQLNDQELQDLIKYIETQYGLRT